MKCNRCPAQIRWIRSEATSRSMPINLDPDTERGNVEVTGNFGKVLNKEDAAAARGRGVALYLNHFATCSNPPKRRK